MLCRINMYHFLAKMYCAYSVTLPGILHCKLCTYLPEKHLKSSKIKENNGLGNIHLVIQWQIQDFKKGGSTATQMHSQALPDSWA